jgi:hypothetical protein
VNRQSLVSVWGVAEAFCLKRNHWICLKAGACFVYKGVYCVKGNWHYVVMF